MFYSGDLFKSTIIYENITDRLHACLNIPANIGLGKVQQILANALGYSTKAQGQIDNTSLTYK
jgi:hypothetical protein